MAEESGGSAVSEELKETLKSVGIISCGFYFLDSANRSKSTHKPRRGMETLPPIDEKALKGDALSHQAMLVFIGEYCRGAIADHWQSGGFRDDR